MDKRINELKKAIERWAMVVGEMRKTSQEIEKEKEKKGR